MEHTPETHGEEHSEEVRRDAERQLFSPRATSKENDAEYNEDIQALEQLLSSLKLEEIPSTPENTEQVKTTLSSILELAMVPEGDFTYSPALEEALQNGAKDIARISTVIEKTLERGADTKRLEELMSRFQQMVLHAKDQVLGQFLKENIPKVDWEKYVQLRCKRLSVKLSLDQVAQQLNVCKHIAKDDLPAAEEASRRWILQTFFGTDEINALHPITQKVVQSIAALHLRIMQELVFPALKKQILAYASKGRLQAFTDRAKQTWELTRDWVSTPFREESHDTMARTLTIPVTIYQEVKEGDVANITQLLPIVKDLAITTGYTTFKEGKLIDLLQTIRGTLEFDVLIMLATMGVGTAARSAQVTGMSGKALAGLAALSGAMKARNLLMNSPRGIHHTALVLSPEKLLAKMQSCAKEQCARIEHTMEELTSKPEVQAALSLLRKIAEERTVSLPELMEHLQELHNAHNIAHALDIVRSAFEEHGLMLPSATTESREEHTEMTEP